MSRLREYNLEEKISSIKNTLDELGRNSARDPGSLDSSRHPSLLRRLDSASSLNSERSIDVFLSQQREHDSRRIDSPPLPYVPEKSMDYSYREEDRPLVAQKWGGALTSSFLRRTHASEECLVNTLPSRSIVDSPALIPVRRSEDELLSDRAKTEMIENMSQLQSELYMKLEECQRQLDYARNYSLEQETQAQLRLEELEKALEEAKVDKARHEGYGESLAVKLQEREGQVAEVNRRQQLNEERLRQTEDRNRTLEERVRVLDERIRNSDEDNRRNSERLKATVRENEEMAVDLRKMRELLAASESMKETFRGESAKAQSEIAALRETIASFEQTISDLRQETDQIPSLTDLLARKEDELSRICEERHMLEQRYADVKSLLKQHDDVANKAFEIRFREAEDRINESWKRKMLTLEQRIVDLTADIENMEMELKSRPTNKTLRDLESNVASLEERLEREQAKGQRRHGSMSVTPTRFRDASKSDQSLVKRLQTELKEANVSDILPRVRELLRAQKSANCGELLIQKLRKLVKDCSPAGTFAENPSPKQMWKWIRVVVEDLMRLRREIDSGKVKIGENFCEETPVKDEDKTPE